jgi:hypothetical protein
MVEFPSKGMVELAIFKQPMSNENETSLSGALPSSLAPWRGVWRCIVTPGALA